MSDEARGQLAEDFNEVVERHLDDGEIDYRDLFDALGKVMATAILAMTRQDPKPSDPWETFQHAMVLIGHAAHDYLTTGLKGLK
jgi:hypothetical protein